MRPSANLSGLIIQPCTCLPSLVGNQNSSGSLKLDLVTTFSFRFVSRLEIDPFPFIQTSGGCDESVETYATSPSSLTENELTIMFPWVTLWTWDASSAALKMWRSSLSCAVKYTSEELPANFGLSDQPGMQE